MKTLETENSGFSLMLYGTHIEFATRHPKLFRQAIGGCKYIVRYGYGCFHSITVWLLFYYWIWSKSQWGL